VFLIPKNNRNLIVSGGTEKGAMVFTQSAVLLIHFHLRAFLVTAFLVTVTSIVISQQLTTNHQPEKRKSETGSRKSETPGVLLISD
jgi:hypothetical protein